jgi:two-component system CheB/CheR fusion protein
MSSADNSEKPSIPADAGENQPDESRTSSLSFPIVGIGASAGGLEAIIEILENLPSSPGLALLIVQHLEPRHKSQLPEILGRVTAMPIHEATEGMKVEVNQIHLIPPNTSMALTDGELTLIPRPMRGQHMPIDHLFRSMAETQKRRAIGVILSGGGTDGTLGSQAIKAEGGITFAQDEKSARHDSMPRSAISDGSVDHILPPREIARALLQLTRHPYTHAIPVEEPVTEEGADVTGKILTLLQTSSGVDFSHYKRATIARRIQRRMALRGFERIEEYLGLVRDDRGELGNLYQDFLIRVTQFFRDPSAFEALKEHVFPALIRDRSTGSPIRIWVAGCSTGEEAYSLAICLLEFLGTRAEQFPIKILATDLNEVTLEKARSGLYIDNIEIDVAPERLRRFFARVDGHYLISKAIRDLCVFSRHNVASDPPFSRLGLVSCRNVLIYMDTILQRRVLPILHYALNPGGFLFLGASENIGSYADLFDVVDSRNRIYSKKLNSGGPPLDFTHYTPADPLGHGPPSKESSPLWSALDVQKEADRIVLSRYAPVGVVIDETMTVLQFRGRTAPYLEPAPGMASLDLLRMLRAGLLADVRGAINQAKAENVPVVRDGLQITEGDRSWPVVIEVIPFKVPASSSRFFLVLFQDSTSRVGPPPVPRAGTVEATPVPVDQQVVQLQQELSALREYLQSVIEEQESTNEELKSANEEILSSNEELQSTNEELQTAKEEAQSTNEELATVNEELNHRNAELARVNNDLVNLLSGVNIPIVMVSRDLRIRRFTPLAEKVFNLIPTDVGRPLSDIKPNLDIADLGEMVGKVIDSLTPQESEIRDRDGRWYSLRIRPYVTLDNKIDGASIVLLDIDTLKRSLEQLKHAQESNHPPEK